MRNSLNIVAVFAAVGAVGLILAKNIPDPGRDSLINVSYDPTRELYKEINAAFESDYARRTGRHLRVVQSHGGSSRQARAVIAGEEHADVVTLGLFSDVDALRKRGLIAGNWADPLPHHSQPYTSTIVFVVRQGNPKHIHDWPDLVQPGVEIITPSPKTSGNGKLSALAAWGAIVTRGGTESEATRYLASTGQGRGLRDPRRHPCRVSRTRIRPRRAECGAAAVLFAVTRRCNDAFGAGERVLLP